MGVLIAFDVDGTLIDTRPSFDRIIREVAGASDDDIRAFRAHGAFNDDWELTRAAMCWIGAGRPRILERCEGLRDVIAWCGHDPGDQALRCTRLYREQYWRDEKPLVDGGQLHELAERVLVAACTGRDRDDLERAEELLRFSFARATTSDDVCKPDPQALLRLLDDDTDVVVMIGDTHADRRCLHAARAARSDVRFFYVHVVQHDTARTLIDQLLEGTDVARIEELAARFEQEGERGDAHPRRD